jgi:hypothetical protein
MAANKSDMYENEQVEEDTGKALAKNLNAIYKNTSAKSAVGVEVIRECNSVGAVQSNWSAIYRSKFR